MSRRFTAPAASQPLLAAAPRKLDDAGIARVRSGGSGDALKAA
jgi:hypothetical protein